MNMESVAGLYKDGLLQFSHGGIDEIKLKKPGGLKSSITSEDKEIILSVLFNDPHIFGYIRNTWRLKISCKMSYKRDWYFNQFQTPTTHN